MNDDGDRTSAPPRALRQLVDELRVEEAPTVDWDRLEAHLETKLDRAATSEPGDGSGVIGMLDVGAGDRLDASILEARGAEEDDERVGAAEILVPWDEDPAEDDAWKALRRPPALTSPTSGGASIPHPLAPHSVVPHPLVAAGRGAARVASPQAGSAPAGSPPAGSPPAGRSRGSRTTMVLGLVAAMASAAAGASLAARPAGVDSSAVTPVDLASVAVEPRLEGALDLASLRAGDVVEAVEGPVRFGRDGVLAWTLSAGGRVRVVAGVGRDELRHVLALEAGALDVDVVVPPGSGAEARSGEPVERFVIEVGDARVAVHGTQFRVVRSSQRIVVDVARGVVAVRGRLDAPGSGRRLEAPQRGAFALDGGDYRALPPREQGHDEQVAGASFDVDGGLSHPAAGGGTPARDVASRPGGSRGRDAMSSARRSEASPAPAGAPRDHVDGAPEDVSRGGRSEEQPGADGGAPGAVDPTATAWSSDRIRAEVVSCIVRSAAASSSEVRVTVSSQLVLDVDANGSARAVRFDPPIRPDLQACAQSVFGARFAPGNHRLVVPVEVVLEPSPR